MTGNRVSISFAESAIEDIESIRSWYQQQLVPDIGERIITEIVTEIEKLEIHPDMGRIVPEFRLPLLRELILPPFRIVYRRDTRKVRIVRVWRSERLLKLP